MGHNPSEEGLEMNKTKKNAEIELQKLLTTIRKNLDMEVSFIAEFESGRRYFKYIDSDKIEPPISIGGSDAIEESYCGLIVAGQLDCVIPDTNANHITKQLEVTSALSIGSYIGIPITLSNDEIYGTLCCFKSDADKTLNDRDVAYLRCVGEMVSEKIESVVGENQKYQSVRDAIDEDAFTIHYQPIICAASGQVVGFESLSRFQGLPHQSTGIWFADAWMVGLGLELELKAITKAVTALDVLESCEYITINASPDTILSGLILEAIGSADPARIVLEVTEHVRVENYQALNLALSSLRNAGIRLAIDDAGAGYASLLHVVELMPDIIKLDVQLVKEINSNKAKYELTKALCSYASSVGCQVVAEGVETAEELGVLQGLCIDYFQGFMLGKPMPIEDAQSYMSSRKSI